MSESRTLCGGPRLWGSSLHGICDKPCDAVLGIVKNEGKTSLGCMFPGVRTVLGKMIVHESFAEHLKM